MKQIAKSVLLVRPRAFGFNVETASSNDYQRILPVFSGQQISVNGLVEFDRVVDLLHKHKIQTTIVEDSDHPIKPDALFPNNWIVTLPDGKVFLFPMHKLSRSAERRAEIVDDLKHNFEVDEVIDLSYFEEENKALEGTGSMVFDHVNKKAYACLSPRTDEEVLNEFCMLSGYTPFVFCAYHSSSSAVYHTNVVLSIGQGFALLCAEVIPDPEERKALIQSLEAAGKEIIFITQQQQEEHFACNALQLAGTDGSMYLVFSDRAVAALSETQKTRLGKHGRLISCELATIESVGGGGIRCLFAEVFLKRRMF